MKKIFRKCRNYYRLQTIMLMDKNCVYFPLSLYFLELVVYKLTLNLIHPNGESVDVELRRKTFNWRMKETILGIKGYTTVL
jgi:hypothetical protein